MLTIPQKIQVGDICTYLASNDVASGALYGGRLDPRLPLMLAIETDCIRWQYDQDPATSTLVGASNYLLSLCGKYLLTALQILDEGGGGDIINPNDPDANTPYLIPITSADFTDATNYDNPDIVGKNLAIFWNDIPKYIISPADWVSTVTGINILVPGFDSTVNDYTLFIYIIN